MRAMCGLVLLSAAAVLIAGCHRGASSKTAVKTKTYAVRGVVVSVDAPHNSITLNHQAIAGLMEAMTMPYNVADPAALGELHPGDMITAKLVADDTPDGPDHFRLTEIVIIAQAKPDYKPAMQYHVPAAGDEVPDFAMLNQSAKTISLKQFRGKVVVMTFIYTRCPLADFCVRMSRNFAQMNQDLEKDGALEGKTHLLSVSFDPDYDTPKVLKSYGEAYTGQYTKANFGHWDFAAPAKKELPKLEQFFDVGVTPGENGTLNHSLSTTVIGKDGKVVAFYPTNEWTPADVEAVIRKAAA
ncbi:MAG: SCO family protein [Acidobacteriota bacterium]